MSTDENYVPINQSFEALEDYLTFIECGFSHDGAKTLASFRHFALPERVPHAVKQWALDIYRFETAEFWAIPPSP